MKGVPGPPRTTRKFRPRAASGPRVVRRGPPRAGFVLLLVLIVVTMVSLAGLSFVLSLSTENKAAHVYGDQIQLEHVLGSGAEVLKAACGLSREERWQIGGLEDNETLFRGALVVDDPDELRQARFSIVSPKIEDGQVTGLRFGARNESACLNLAVLLQWEQAEEGAAQRALLNLPGMTDTMADAILDWLDPDDAPRPAGAEAEYYSGRGLPYGPRNGVPTSLEELLLVREVGRDLVFGPDANFNSRIEPSEWQLASASTGARVVDRGSPWAALLTVYSAERNVTYQGNPRINLNQKDLRKLQGQLDEVFDPEWTRFIIAYRQFGPYQQGRAGRAGLEGQMVFGPPFPDRPGRRGRRSEGPVRLDLSLPARFEIPSVLDLIGARVQLPGRDQPASSGRSGPASRKGRPPSPKGPRGAGNPARDSAAEPQILVSPFADDPVAMRDYLPQLVDRTTVVDKEVLVGRVNVNEAPREVLLGVPGLDASQVDQILAARGIGPDLSDPVRRDATWLVIEGIVDRDQMKQIEPYVTGGGDVFRAQVVATYGDGRLFARAELVVDGTDSPPRQLYWKDLGLLGRGYPLEELGMGPTGPAAAAGNATEGLDTALPWE